MQNADMPNILYGSVTCLLLVHGVPWMALEWKWVIIILYLSTWSCRGIQSLYGAVLSSVDGLSYVV